MIMTVGSERLLFDHLMYTRRPGFREADPAVTVSIDVDPGISRFHRVNALLLRAAGLGDMITYRRLRTQPEPEEWSAAGKQALSEGRLSQRDLKRLRANFEWWREHVGDESKWRRFYSEPRQPGDPFYGANYLFSKEAFALIQRLASSGHYQQIGVDLGDRRQVHRMVEHIAAAKTPLAVLDLSNNCMDTFPNNYLGVKGLEVLLKELDAVACDDTLLIFSDGRRNTDWIFHGYSFKVFRQIAGHRSSWSKEVLTWEHAAGTIEGPLEDHFHALSDADRRRIIFGSRDPAPFWRFFDQRPGFWD
jgi:hypothetical protein